MHPGQQVKIKLMAYPFQKYGMVEGKVLQVSADSTDKTAPNQQNSEQNALQSQAVYSYKTIVQLKQQHLLLDNDNLALSSGMQVAAEIKLGDQTVMEYLLSPVRRAFHEAGRER